MKIDFLPKSKRYLSPPVDEVALHESAIHALSGPNLDIADAISKADVDLATCMLFNHIRQSKHGAFIREIEGLPAEAKQAKEKIRILVVPGMFHAEYPDVGADGGLASAIFARNGFDVQFVDVNSRGTVKENQEIVRRALMGVGSEKVWLVSISKGTADVRACLQNMAESDLPKNLKGWINFSGIYAGSILADHRSDTRMKRLALRGICALAGVDYRLVGELSTTHESWRRRDTYTEKLELIHVLGFPLASHVQPLLSHRFARLSKAGPTDGMIRLIDSLEYPGHVYPVWGCDHFGRHPQLSALLYRLSHYISRPPTQDIQS